jgi:Holliday junction resolvase
MRTSSVGRPSRDKGKRGEREVVELAKAAGFEDAHRTAAMQSSRVEYADVHIHPELHAEVKRQENLRLPEWTRQAEEQARPGAEPVVFYRRSNEPWRASVDAAWLLRLLRRDLA